jgi:glycosyltransferase involved in cell wall biosynthesis
MNWRQSCIGLIPCLNEEAAIGPVVVGVHQYIDRILVVDDGSSDGTARTARANGAEVLQHPVPMGKGGALADGFRRARDEGFAWALTLDGDGQHAPGDIPKFFRAAEESQAALIVGNRMSSAQSMPAVRRWVNQWMSRRLSRLAGRELPDSQCGFRLVRLDAWNRLNLHTRHFEIESEMLMGFIKAGHEVVFVPVEVIYKSEQSKIHPLRDTIRWFRWLRSARKR